MSRLTEMLRQTYEGIKEAIENAISHVENQYATAKTRAETAGAQSKYDPDTTWEEQWHNTITGIPKDDYCRLKTATKVEYDSLSFRVDLNANYVNSGSAPPQAVENYYKLKAFKDQLKIVLDLLEALCTLKKNLEAICVFVKAYGG